MTQGLEIKFTEEQQHAINCAVNFFMTNNKGLFRIGGYAGTGKTTILKQILKCVPDVGVCAYTGKAASVLRGKGVENATTIHRKIYKWNENYQEFRKLDKIGFSGLALDEASMVGGTIFEDLKSYGIPILAIGDPGQLEPINSSDLNLMAEPDIVLDKIHRQALDNPIINLATRVRLKQMWGFQDSDERCVVEKKRELNDIDFSQADVVLCGTNRVRCDINRRIRNRNKVKGFLAEGEKIICLQNDMHFGVFNGLCFRVTAIHPTVDRDYLFATLVDDSGQVYERMKIWTGHFNLERAKDWKITRRLAGKALVCDYGNAMTVHKSQGSEYKNVIVYDEQFPELWSPTRHRYTAFTRASERLKVFK